MLGICWEQKLLRSTFSLRKPLLCSCGPQGIGLLPAYGQSPHVQLCQTGCGRRWPGVATQPGLSSCQAGRALAARRGQALTESRAQAQAPVVVAVVSLPAAPWACSASLRPPCDRCFLSSDHAWFSFLCHLCVGTCGGSCNCNF